MMKILVPLLFALGTALCWGSYGPTLGLARKADPAATAMKPYLAIGGAYLVWAIIGGVIGMTVLGDTFKMSGESSRTITNSETGATITKTGNAGKGMLMAFCAGSLGAFGALSLTLAMSSGGMHIPHVVMPVVFGGAVTVNAIVSKIQHPDLKGSPLLWVGVVGIFACTILVAANTPHATPPKKAPAAEKSVDTPAPAAK